MQQAHVEDEDQSQLLHTMLFFVRNIYRTFLSPHAPHELNLSAGVSRAAKSTYELGFAESSSCESHAVKFVDEMLEWLGPPYDVRRLAVHINCA
jgi:hypothetical protein